MFQQVELLPTAQQCSRPAGCCLPISPPWNGVYLLKWAFGFCSVKAVLLLRAEPGLLGVSFPSVRRRGSPTHAAASEVAYYDGHTPAHSILVGSFQKYCTAVIFLAVMLMESGKSIVLKEQGNEMCCKCHRMSDWLIAGMVIQTRLISTLSWWIFMVLPFFPL